MNPEEWFWRRMIVYASGLVYWAGVVIQARRVRRRIGHSPNVRPQGARERFLWAVWFLVILFWIVQPMIATAGSVWAITWMPDSLHWPGFILGTLLVVAGYAGTLWCYASMGDMWRIGINQKEKTHLVTVGPYRWVRHPIYALQTVILIGATLLLPTPLSPMLVAIHLLCVMVKSADEEAYLLKLHGDSYKDYVGRTGGLLPKPFG